MFDRWEKGKGKRPKKTWGRQVPLVCRVSNNIAGEAVGCLAGLANTEGCVL